MKNHEAAGQQEKKRPADIMEEELLAITGGADPTPAQMQDYLTKYISDNRPLDLQTLAALDVIAQGNSYLEGVIAKGDHLKKALLEELANTDEQLSRGIGYIADMISKVKDSTNAQELRKLLAHQVLDREIAEGHTEWLLDELVHLAIEDKTLLSSNPDSKYIDTAIRIAQKCGDAKTASENQLYIHDLADFLSDDKLSQYEIFDEDGNISEIAQNYMMLNHDEMCGESVLFDDDHNIIASMLEERAGRKSLKYLNRQERMLALAAIMRGFSTETMEMMLDSELTWRLYPLIAYSSEYRLRKIITRSRGLNGYLPDEVEKAFKPAAEYQGKVMQDSWELNGIDAFLRIKSYMDEAAANGHDISKVQKH